MSNKTVPPKSLSPGRKSLRRLLRNKPAVFGLSVIALALLTAVFSYVIAPDNTTDANDQILQLETHDPGFSIDLLQIRKNQAFEDRSLLSTLADGRQNRYKSVPVLNYSFENGKILYEEYRGQGRDSRMAEAALHDVAFSVEDKELTQAYNTGKFNFTSLSGEQIEIDESELIERVKSNHIERRTYLLGTDKFGRDVISRIIIGIRVSLSVGIVAVFISVFIGIILGALSGYFRGWIDNAIMWLINVFWSIPTLLLAMGLTINFDAANFWLIYIAVGLTMWVEMARIVRGQFLSAREMEFVEAAQSLGFGHFRTIFIHIFPNILGPVIVIAAVNFAAAILIEAGLSFIGLGVQPPKPSWGTMLKEYWSFIGTSKGYLSVFPGMAIMLLVLAFNLIGNGLRDALDVKTNL